MYQKWRVTPNALLDVSPFYSRMPHGCATHLDHVQCLVDERVLGALSVAHVVSIGVTVVGVALLLRRRRMRCRVELRPRERQT